MYSRARSGDAIPAIVSAVCPTCGTTLSAPSLAALTKKVQGCCSSKRKPSKRAAAKQAAKEPITVELPYAVEFERLVVSQNQSTYSHWSRYRKDKKDWVGRVGVRCRALKGVRLSWSSWLIERIYAHPNKEMDYANFVGGCKPLVDSLIEHNIIEDDNPRNFDCDYKQIRGSVSCTRLTLLEYRHGA